MGKDILIYGPKRAYGCMKMAKIRVHSPFCNATIYILFIIIIIIINIKKKVVFGENKNERRNTSNARFFEGDRRA